MGSFTEKTNQVVWSESLRVMDLCMADWERLGVVDSEGRRTVVIPNFCHLTFKIGLFIIAGTAFSQRPPWKDDEIDAIPAGHTVPFRVAVNGVIGGSMLHVMTPSWTYKLPIPRRHHVANCFVEFELYLKEMIRERRALAEDPREDEQGRRDL